MLSSYASAAQTAGFYLPYQSEAAGIAHPKKPRSSHIKASIKKNWQLCSHYSGCLQKHLWGSTMHDLSSVVVCVTNGRLCTRRLAGLRGTWDSVRQGRRPFPQPSHDAGPPPQIPSEVPQVCAVLHWAVLRCAVLCCAALRCTALC